MDILISLIIGICLMELYVWLPGISKWILERAVRGVREEIRERCREEWNEGLDALPNTMLKVVHALSYVCGNTVAKINSDSFGADHNEIDDLLAGLSNQYQSVVKDLCAIEAKRHPKSYFEDALRKVLPNAAAIDQISKHPNTRHLQRAMSAVGEFGETAIGASKLAWELLDVSLTVTHGQLDHVGGLIQEASNKFCRAKDLLRRGDVSSGALETLTKGLYADLDIIKSILAADDWGDDAATQAHRNAMGAYEKAVEDLRGLVQRTSRQISEDARA